MGWVFVKLYTPSAAYIGHAPSAWSRCSHYHPKCFFSTVMGQGFLRVYGRKIQKSVRSRDCLTPGFTEIGMFPLVSMMLCTSSWRQCSVGGEFEEGVPYRSSPAYKHPTYVQTSIPTNAWESGSIDLWTATGLQASPAMWKFIFRLHFQLLNCTGYKQYTGSETYCSLGRVCGCS